jgi:hypothetical protein
VPGWGADEAFGVEGIGLIGNLLSQFDDLTGQAYCSITWVSRVMPL